MGWEPEVDPAAKLGLGFTQFRRTDEKVNSTSALTSLSPRSRSKANGSAAKYAERVANISGTGVGPRANGGYFLTPGSTLLDDGAVDKILGGTELDWALFRLAQDIFQDEKPGETKTGT